MIFVIFLIDIYIPIANVGLFFFGKLVVKLIFNDFRRVVFDGINFRLIFPRNGAVFGVRYRIIFFEKIDVTAVIRNGT